MFMMSRKSYFLVDYASSGDVVSTYCVCCYLIALPNARMQLVLKPPSAPSEIPCKIARQSLWVSSQGTLAD